MKDKIDTISPMTEIKPTALLWTEIEKQYPQINLSPDLDGLNECPSCHGRGSITKRNFATLSPSDDFEAVCGFCDGDGEIIVKDDRYG